MNAQQFRLPICSRHDPIPYGRRDYLTVLAVFVCVCVLAPSAFAVPSTVNCWSSVHYNGYVSNQVFGGASGFVRAHNIPALSNPNNVVAAFVGVTGVNSCGGGQHACWIQLGVYQGNGTPGYDAYDSVYWEANTPYQYTAVRLFSAPNAAIFFTVWNTGQTDVYGNPSWNLYYHFDGDPTSHFINNAHQDGWYEYETAQTEMHNAAFSACPRTGQIDFGFGTTGQLDSAHGLKNAPYPSWPWTLWTSSSQIIRQGQAAWTLYDWEHYWAFTVNDT